MLTKGDDFPIHQTAEPIAYSGTDRNFYDRYFFNGYGPDGEDQFGVAFGVYPHLNIADAHVSVLRDGVQHCVSASRHLDMERLDLQVGPISIEVVEPLQQLTVRLDHEGMSAELRFTGRAAPVQEPRFTYRDGPRTFMDYTRLTQNGRYEGFIEVDGDRRSIDGFLGTRDRSWGVRPIGVPDAQPRVPAAEPQFFWLWSPLQFETQSVFFHVNDDRFGRPWNTRAVIVPDGSQQGEATEIDDVKCELQLKPGTRWAESARLRIGDVATIDYEPTGQFQMRGIGYFDPVWFHGSPHAELEVERRTVPVADFGDPSSLHIQAFAKVTMTHADGRTEQGHGVLEQCLLGPYEPLGLTGLVDAGTWI